MEYGLGGSSEEIPGNKDISSGQFWPTISTSSFYGEYRVPGELSEPLVLDHLRLAIARVNAALLNYKATQQAAGNNTLADCVSETIDDVNVKVLLYRRAVYCEAKAEILKETQTVMRKPDAENIAKASEETEDKYREFAQEAIRMIADKSRVEVQLI